MGVFLYGLEHASHDFGEPESLGKNIFTNAFPISLGQYISQERELEIPLIKSVESGNRIRTDHVMTDWAEILGIDPKDAFFSFEEVFNGYARYTHTSANKSDVVVCNRFSGDHKRAFEIKLVVVPTSQTADRPLREQTCEIVLRPSTVQQLTFSLAHSFGEEGRIALQRMLVGALGRPSEYEWTNEGLMVDQIPKILAAAEQVSAYGSSFQTPFALMATWRTEGQQITLAEEAFEIFAWTDVAFLQLFCDHLSREIARGSRSMSRPSRSLIQLTKNLLDYSIQGSLDFRQFAQIGLTQTDKAGAFSGSNSLKHLASQEFFHPRVSRSEIERILAPAARSHLRPERRLDAALVFQFVLDKYRGGA